MRHFLIGTAATAIAFAIVTYLLPKIDFGGTIPQLILLAVVFGVVNGVIKPVVKLFSFPITAMTLGLFSLVINAAMFLLVAWVAGDLLKIPFTVGGFPASGLSLDAFIWALVGSIVLSIVSTIVGLVIHD
jgi:putative membrane protein